MNPRKMTNAIAAMTAAELLMDDRRAFRRDWHGRCLQIVQVAETSRAAVGSLAFFREFYDRVANALECDQIGVFVLDSAGNYLVECSSLATASVGEFSRLPRALARIERVRERKETVVTDCETPDREDYVPQANKEDGILTVLSAPMLSGGTVIGLLAALYKRKVFLASEDVEYIALMGRACGTIVGTISWPSCCGLAGLPEEPSMAVSGPRGDFGKGTDESLRALLRLSARERQVMAMVAQGLPNEQIAKELHLSTSSVKKIVSSLMQKLGVDNRVQVAILAMRLEPTCRSRAEAEL